jgi:uncharacterized protein
MNINKDSSVYSIGVVAITSIAVSLVLFLLASAVNEVREYHYIGKSPIYPATLPVTGKGEVFAVPNIASFSFSVIEQGKTVPEAQDKATEKNNDAISFLKGRGIEEKDIKTTGYNINPRYEYVQATGRQNLVGYEVSQSVTVKVRKADTAGDVLAGIGGLGVSNVSSLDFTVDEQDELKRQARDMAIADAKEQAEKLAMQLGVRLGKIISYYEMENGPYPYYEGMGGDMMKSAVAPRLAPTLNPGQDKITSQVSISFELID